MTDKAKLFNTHPEAAEKEILVLTELKKSSNWIEGTIIRHDWDLTKGVQFIYAFPNTGDKTVDDAWDVEIKSVIKQYPKQD